MENEGTGINVKIAVAAAAILFAALVAYSLLKSPGGAPETGSKAAPGMESGIVISVNDDKITRDDFNIHLSRQVDFLKASLAKKGNPDELEGEKGKELMKKLKKDVAAELIRQTLIIQDAIAKGMEPSKDDIEAEISATISRLPPGKKIEDILKAHNITQDQFRREVRRKLILRKYDAVLSADIKVADSDAKAFFEAHRAEYDKPGKKAKFEDVRKSVTDRLVWDKLRMKYAEKFTTLKGKAKISVSRDL